MASSLSFSSVQDLISEPLLDEMFSLDTPTIGFLKYHFFKNEESPYVTKWHTMHKKDTQPTKGQCPWTPIPKNETPRNKIRKEKISRSLIASDNKHIT